MSQLYIKGMVCERCIAVVRSEMEQMGITVYKVELGVVTVISAHEEIDMTSLSVRLGALGFQLLEDRKLAMVRQIKALVAQVFSGVFDFPHHFRFSDLVSATVSRDYSSLSTLFSMVEHKTLEQYIILYRIGKVKEFLMYSDSTLSDIAFRLNYSSVAHLSTQFRQVTGVRPSVFREQRRNVQASMSKPSQDQL